jgi:glycosyltransferase involved in cell wall biosynthesis
VGEETADGRERLLAKSLGVDERIRFFGRQENPALVLHASDLFIMPSLVEGFGIAAVEAMAAGVPVALSRVPALWDFAELSESITWVAPNEGGVHEAIRQGFGASTGETARARQQDLAASVREHFHMDVGASALARIYKRGCRRGRACIRKS